MVKRKKQTSQSSTYINFLENIYYWLWLQFSKSEDKKRKNYTKEYAGALLFSCILGNLTFLCSFYLLFKKDALHFLFSKPQLTDTLKILLIVIFVLAVLCYIIFSCRTTSIVRRVGQLNKKNRNTKQRIYRIYILLTILTILIIPFGFRYL